MLGRSMRAVGAGLLLVVCWCALVPASLAASQDANGATVSLGQAVFNGEMTTAELSFRHERWELGATILGQGDTEEGEQRELAYAASITRLLRPGWEWCRGSIYGRAGVAYIDGSPLVGHFNFRTGIGIDFRAFALEYTHYSSGGLTPLNTGVDVVQFRLAF